MARKLTQEEFIAKAVAIHGDKYDYSKVVYINTRTKIEVSCNHCGNTILIPPKKHLLPQRGCRRCHHNKQRMSREEFIARSVSVHGEKYDYSRVVFNGTANKVELVCNRCCEPMWITPTNHYFCGHGCRKCSYEQLALTTEEFIGRCKIRHGDVAYDYSRVTHSNSKGKVEIGCNRCGAYFFQRPDGHAVYGYGCPKCRSRCRRRRW